MGMITLKWSGGGQDIEVNVDDSIPTCDLLEVIDVFIRLTSREPSGVLDYTPIEKLITPMTNP